MAAPKLTALSLSVTVHATILAVAFAPWLARRASATWRATTAATVTSHVLDADEEPDGAGAPPLPVPRVLPEPVEPPRDDVLCPEAEAATPIACEAPQDVVAPEPEAAIAWLTPVVKHAPRTDATNSASVEATPMADANEPPNYPWVPWRRGIEGTVAIELHIDATGCVTAASIAASSGNTDLDRAALDRLATWKFLPARSGGGAVASVLRQDVIFRIGRVTVRT
ncbi:MAG: energy transducer TonB [Planctomycetes bacterium]|nr:energy transducer TonB [Planctomycetota bacterium]